MSAVGASCHERLEVRPDWPHFAGHFEGRPILPGIAHLQLVREAVRRVAGPDLELVAVEVLRLRRVVAPGDVLVLEAKRRDAGRWAFELRCGPELASQGRVTTGRCPVAEPEVGPRQVPVGLFPAPPALMPHRGPALLLAGVSGASEDRLEAIAVVPHDSPFAAGGVAAPLIALELAAQAAAAFEALRRRQAGGSGDPRVGYLVGAREVVLEAALPTRSPVRVAVSLDAAVPPLSTYRFEVGVGRTVAARGTISTYLA